MNKLMLIPTLALLSSPALSASMYKMAILSDGAISTAIKKGAYEKSISRIGKSNGDKDIYQQLTDSMNLCVAHVNLLQIEEAKAPCEQAVLLTQAQQASKRLNNIGSLALNNRAILKIKSNNYQGALSDLLAAVAINDNQFAKENLIKLMQKQATKVQFKS